MRHRTNPCRRRSHLLNRLRCWVLHALLRLERNFSCCCPRLGTKKVKASVLNRILERVTSEEELKYASLGLKIFKTQGIDLKKESATLFVKVM